MLSELGVHSVGLFMLTGLLLNLTPGADTLFVVARSVSGGRGVGVLSAIGISTGSLVHCLMVAFGLSSVLVSEPWVFALVQGAGVVWLVVLAVQSWANAGKPATATQPLTHSGRATVFAQAMATNLLNPKVALFFLALLPQFVLPADASRPMPYLVLGFAFICTGTVVSVAQALLAAHLSVALRERSRWQLTQRITAVWMFGLALWLAVALRDGLLSH